MNKHLRFVSSVLVGLLLCHPVMGSESPPLEVPLPSSQTFSPHDRTPPVATVPPEAYTRSNVLVWTALGFGLLHHTDHVLRGNHSGFPFTSRITAFSPTLLIYPLVLGGIYFDAGPLYWVLLDGAAFAGVIAIHLTLEPVHHVYEPWADGSNHLGARAPAMGGVALGILSGLTLSLGANLVSSWIDGHLYGFTWQRKPPGAPLATKRVSVAFTNDGVAAVWRW